MKTIAVVLVSFALASCSGAENEDLRQWMNAATKDIKGRISPLPQVKPYEPVPYDAGNLMDPFKSSKIGSEQKKSGGSGMQPDLERAREPLEAYPLETLKYVGVMTRKKVSYALIQVDGALYQVKVGNYLGQNFGVVTKVSESETILKELIQDSAGDWVERTSTLLLQGQEGKK
jgi:type IV pilus assembly protein PilP